MPNSPHLPQVAFSKTYNISVVGPPKAGKSCLCNRFALPHPDYYRKDHLSVLSAADFVGEIVNFDHWLYWGCVSRQVDDYTVNFRIIEQTEFINDSTFQPFISKKRGLEPGSSGDYIQRSTAVHLSSENKLRYICKEQLGQENVYEKEYFPAGQIEVNGFVLVCDISRQLVRNHPRPDRSCVPQHTLIQEILTFLLKLKKPVVLAVSKFDACESQAVEELSSLLQKSSEFKRVPLIETSAHENINIEDTFLSLVKLIDKPRAQKIKCPRYVDAVQHRKTELSTSLSSFYKVMRQAPTEFLNSWDSFMARYSQQADVVTYIRLVGTTFARSKFEQYVEYRRQVTKQQNLDQIAELLSHFLPSLDIVRNKSFSAVAQYIRDQENFSVYFRDAPANAILPEPTRMTNSAREDMRIPFNLVVEPYTSDYQGSPLQQYLDELAVAERRHFEQARLETTLQCLVNDTNFNASLGGCSSQSPGTVLPGQPLSDLPHIVQSLQSTILDEESVTQVYKTFQVGLRVRAREEFLDLLLERTDIFVSCARLYVRRLIENSSRNGTSAVGTCILSLPDLSGRAALSDLWDTTSPLTTSGTLGVNNDAHTDVSNSALLGAPPRGLKETILRWLESQLSLDDRYQAMMFLPSERQTLVASYFNTLLPFLTEALQQTGTVATGRFGTAEVKSSDTFQPPCSWLPAQNCPSTSWGGCMDQLLKRLAYRDLPINPRCLEPVVPAFSRELNEDTNIGSAACLDYTYGPSYFSCFGCRTSGPRKATLSIGVACVCSDTMAAQAVIHLFGCIGFSMASLLPHLDTSQSTEYECSAPKLGHLAGDIESLHLSSSWPLSTDRLPSVQPVYPQSHSTATTNTTPTTATTRSNYTGKIQNGQVHTSVMSVHKLLRELIAMGAETPKDDGLITTSEIIINSDASISGNRTLHHGYIFVLSDAPISDSHEPWLNPTDFTSQTVSPVNTPHLPDTTLSDTGNGRVSRTALRRMNSIDADDGTETDENGLTPRPGLDKSFFGNESNPEPLEPQLVSRWTQMNIEDDAVKQPPCLCCSLLRDDHPSEENCVCGRCCTCAQAGLINHAKEQPVSNMSATPLSPRTESRSSTGGFTQRSWTARLTAVRAAISLLPVDIPHLVLLTREAQHSSGTDMSEKVENMHSATKQSNTSGTNNAMGAYNSENLSNTNSQTPLIFPAPSSLCARFGRLTCSKSDVASDLSTLRQTDDMNARSPMDSVTDDADEVSDWMREGTHVLDHVIRFLNLCWEKSESLTNAHLSDRVRQTRSRSATCQCLDTLCTSESVSQKRKMNARSSGQLNTLDKTVTGSAIVEKQSNNILFHSLSAASATGRRAMHTANQTLRKLSASAKKQHKTNASLASPTCTVVTMPKLQSSANVSHASPHPVHHKSPPITSSVPLTKPSKRLNALDEPSEQAIDRPICLKNSADATSAPRFAPVCWALGGFSPDNTDEQLTASSVFGQTDSPSISPSNPPFLMSSLCASVDHRNFPLRRGAMSNASSVTRSRCSVPDCTLLVASDEYRKMINTSITSSAPAPSAVSASSNSPRPFSSVFGGTTTINNWSAVGSSARRMQQKIAGWQDPPVTIGSKHILSQTAGPDANEIPGRNAAFESMDNLVNGTQNVDQISLCSTPKPFGEPIDSMATTTISNSNAPSVDLSTSTSIAISTPCPLSASSSKLVDTVTDSAGQRDDLESIYMDLDLISSQQVQNNASEFIPPSGAGGNANVLRSSLYPPLAVDTDIEEHIYHDPIDCLGPAQLERLHCTGNHWFTSVHVPIQTSSSKSTVSSLIGNNVLRAHDNPPITNRHGGNRERHRSFSTPEGCVTVQTNPDRDLSGLVNFTHSDHVPDESTVLHTTPRGFMQSATQSCLTRGPAVLSSMGSSISAVPTTSSLCSLGNCQFSSALPKPDVAVSLNHSLDSSASCVRSECCFSEPATGSTDEPTWARGYDSHGVPYTVHRAHHHHFWHHSNCPHHRIHQVMLEKFSIDAGGSLAPTGLGAVDLNSARLGKNEPTTGRRCANSPPKSSDLSLLKTGANFLRLKQRSLPGSAIISTRHAPTGSASTSFSTQHSSAKIMLSHSTDSSGHRFTRSQRSIDLFPNTSNLDFTPTSTKTATKDSKWMKRGKKVF